MPRFLAVGRPSKKIGSGGGVPTPFYSFGGGSLVVLVSSIIFLGTLYSPPSLMDDVDAVNATLARNMLESGDWVTGRLNGVLYVDKAPLNYWLMATAYKIFGVYDWVARLPMALASIALCWVTFKFASWAFSAQAGLWAGLVLASSVGMFLFTRIRIPDVALTLFCVMAVYALVRVLDETERRTVYWPLMLGACMSAAVLLKGFVGVVFPIAIGALYMFFTGHLFSRTSWLRLRPLVVFGVFISLTAPWHALAMIRNPPYFDFTLVSRPGEYRGFFWRYFINEQVLRYLDARYPRDYNTVPQIQFWLLHAVWLFPWSTFLPAVFVRGNQKRIAEFINENESKRGPVILLRRAVFFTRRWLDCLIATRAGRIKLLAFIWIFAVLGFFSFSTSQEYYTLPAYPAFALLIGSTLTEGGHIVRRCMRAVSIIAGMGFLIVAGLLVVVWNTSAPGDIASALTYNPGVYTFSLGHMRDLTLNAFAYLRLPLVLTAVACIIGAVISWNSGRFALSSLVVMMLIFVHAAHLAMVSFDPYLSSRPLAEALRKAPRGIFIADDQYYSFSSIFFYANRGGLLLNGRKNNLEYGSNEPGAPAVFIDDDEFRQRWSSETRYYLATFERERPRLENLVDPTTLILASQAGGKLLLTNYPLRAEIP